jgi:hypothetical protein
LFLIPASEETRGHGTTGMAKFYKATFGRVAARRAGGGEIGASSHVAIMTLSQHNPGPLVSGRHRSGLGEKELKEHE